MIPALFVLLGCQLCGEVLVRALALPLPGPVAGLMLLFAGLAIRGRREPGHAGTVPHDLGIVCDFLLRNLALLFIPAAVGVVQYLTLMRTFALPIALAIVVSTVLALVVTALVFVAVSRLVARRVARREAVGRREVPAEPAEEPR